MNAPECDYADLSAPPSIGERRTRRWRVADVNAVPALLSTGFVVALMIGVVVSVRLATAVDGVPDTAPPALAPAHSSVDEVSSPTVGTPPVESPEVAGPSVESPPPEVVAPRPAAPPQEAPPRPIAPRLVPDPTSASESRESTAGRDDDDETKDSRRDDKPSRKPDLTAPERSDITARRTDPEQRTKEEQQRELVRSICAQYGFSPDRCEQQARQQDQGPQYGQRQHGQQLPQGFGR